MTPCRHHWVCKNQTPTGTPAHCWLCGAETTIPPLRAPKGMCKTIAGLGLSAKRRFELEQDLFHAEALAHEGYRGARE